MTKTPTHHFRTPVTAPGPLGQTMVRSMGAIRRNPLSYLNEVWRQHGDVVQFPIPRPPTYLVNRPEGVRRVLVDRLLLGGVRAIWLAICMFLLLISRL